MMKNIRDKNKMILHETERTSEREFYFKYLASVSFWFKHLCLVYSVFWLVAKKPVPL